MCISPLTAIMIDQKAKFSPKGIVTNFIGEAQDDPETIRNVLQGKQLLFVNPESLLRNRSSL